MLNKVILIGRLANEPELKYTPSGIAVTTFRLAVERPMSSEARQAGQAKEADFIDIVAWRQQAEFASNYLGKGRLVSIEGRLHIRQYQAPDGTNRRQAEVVVEQLKSLERPRDTTSSPDGNEPAQREPSGSYREQEPTAPRPASSANGYSRQDQRAGMDGDAARRTPPSQGSYSSQPSVSTPAPPPARSATIAPTDEFESDAFADDLDDPFADN